MRIPSYFGITGLVTYRFASLRVVATIYTVIYALLIPLAGFSAYRLIAGNYIQLSVPVLVAIAAAYAASVYTLLAIYQRFGLFAYLGIVALAITDMAIADALGLSYWWWPSMLMILTFAALVSLRQSRGIGWLFARKREVLRKPMHIFLYVFAGTSALSILALANYSLTLDISGMQHVEVRFSIFSLTLLGLLWSGLYLWLTRRTQYVSGLAFLLLIALLALCYSLAFEAIGYALALTAVALLYHGFGRFTPRLLQPFGTLEHTLDWIALSWTIWLWYPPLDLAPLFEVPTALRNAAGRRFLITALQEQAHLTLRGTPASAGRVTALARVILDPHQAILEPGEILVAPSTDPAWTPLFLTAAGLVMETGGAMAHGAIVAREYGLPAVVGVAGATTRIVTGSRVTLDGTTGIVLLEENDAGQ